LRHEIGRRRLRRHAPAVGGHETLAQQRARLAGHRLREGEIGFHRGQSTLGFAMAALPVIILAYAPPYLIRCHTLAQAGRPVARWRQWSFMLGLLTLVGASVAPSDKKFAIHMVEHLLIGDIAALLIALGLTGPVLAPILRLHGLRWLR